MASTTQVTPSPIDEAFVADRAVFWHRFTGFVKGGIVGVVILLLILLIFVY